MKVLIGFVIAMSQLLTFSVMTGWLALSVNRKFWPWFVVGLFLPYLGALIIVCLPVKEKKGRQGLLKSISSEEISDQVLELEDPRRINGSEIHFFPRA
jgi:hypothetical protein